MDEGSVLGTQRYCPEQEGVISSCPHQCDFLGLRAASDLCPGAGARSPGAALSSATLQRNLFTELLARSQILSPLPPFLQISYSFPSPLAPAAKPIDLSGLCLTHEPCKILSSPRALCLLGNVAAWRSANRSPPAALCCISEGWFACNAAHP